MSGPPVTESEPEALPESVFKIKEAFGKYTEEEIFTLLKECNMDPDQATEKLQFLETFQDVKRKERKVVVKRYNNNSKNDDEWQNQRRSNQYHAPRQENRSELRFFQRKNGPQPRGGANQENGSRAKGAPPKAPKSETIVPLAAGSVAPPKVEESTSRPATTKNPSPAKSNLNKNRPKEQLNVSSGSNSGPGPTPASTPTNDAPSVPRQQQQQQPSKSSLGKGPLPSPSDPVVLQSLIPPRNHHGAIQRETTRNQKEGTIVVDFLGKAQSVVFPNQVLAPEDFKTNILFGSIGTLDTYLEKSSDVAEPAEPQSSPPPQVPEVTSQENNSDPIFNQPKQEVLPPVSRSQQDSPPQQETIKLTPPQPRAQSSSLNFPPYPPNIYQSMYPFYSAGFIPQVPAQNVVQPMVGHGGYANQLMTGVAGAKYQYVRPREDNKEESMYYNLPQAYPLPPPAGQGGHGYPSVFHQSQRPHVQSQQQQMGGEQSAPLSSYPWSQLQQYGGGPYRNPNREN